MFVKPSLNRDAADDSTWPRPSWDLTGDVELASHASPEVAADFTAGHSGDISRLRDPSNTLSLIVGSSHQADDVDVSCHVSPPRLTAASGQATVGRESPCTFTLE